MKTYYEAGEQTTAYTKIRGRCSLQPTRVCDHVHRTRDGAEKCAAKHYPWTVYIVTLEEVDGHLRHIRRRAVEVE